MALPVSRWTICLIFLFRVEVKTPSPDAPLVTGWQFISEPQAYDILQLGECVWPTFILVELSLQCGESCPNT